ncbi:unnamed protein product [Bursaphelenchus xylophilus]|uniref:Carboxypeptidase n=1 Tax=Bursaphelenchus xylophilus TaxID=6326 RepID=A0A1I7SDW4_BURXY|nr:unnamed protein product [Bursaphelenchus xylophilus]CAG9100324.1 unnamed protein product [Bursaphelenchus xylophilus]
MLSEFIISPFLIVFCVADIKSDHEVKSLPGLDWELNFKHYAGRLNVSDTRRLSYWLVESQNDKNKDPLVLWLNGGPGCSSLFGLLEEHGPFVLVEGHDVDLKLHKNPNAWNKFANVLYLEAPAGVGFSQNDETNFPSYDDTTTAIDNANFLSAFVKAYPEYKGRDFYITGESYGGCYVPTLANQVLRVQDEVNLNLKGVAIGNGITTKADVDSFYTVALAFHGAKYTLQDLGLWMREYCPSGFDNFCIGGKTDVDPEFQKRFANMYHNMMKGSKNDEIYNYDINRKDPGSATLAEYLNQIEVQKALHFVEEGEQKVDWVECGNVGYQWCTDMAGDVTNLLNKNIKVLYFYGETDLACPAAIGDIFVHRIGKNPKTSTWFVDDLYAGTRTSFDKNLTYTTIADCGHMAAAWKPKQTARAVHHFINDISDWNS